MEILSRPMTFRVVAAATALLLGIGLVAAVSVEEDPDTLDFTAETTTTLGEGETPDLEPGPAPGEPGGPPATEPGAPPPPPQPTPGPGPGPTAAPPPASSEPGPMTPTRPGLYRYKATNDGKEGRSELRVSEESGAPSGEQRRMHRRTADGNTTEASVAWRRDGVFERSRTFPAAGGGSGTPCDWEPDLLLAPRPLKADSTWKWDSRCSSQIEGQNADFHFIGEARVTGAQRAAVGGKSVNVWRIQSTGKMNITGSYQGQPFTVVVDIVSDDQFAPQQGIVVRSDQTTKITPPGRPTQENRTIEELLNLDPA